ncbi:translation initiation factor eIF-1A [Halorubrum sp. Ib24]|uniref:translation initiation factor eIF-1A n=1 Tax=unclassified Halorubrum TaxID=2642239 RepID=UPI000B994886|nr:MULTISPECIES: translation initiation factor eIF-1A [unclassified Halorubrum]OYR38031.1 translation initiation factor eIF-1A [Halorubrum sp. Ib24]OYR44792.1 translation initiation factor eIF-1A [Halorubrum sp. Hd13]OYR50025.1 translation initiation factor eIF-1A [Halorubrum sp. Eb13]OYR53475.1 translation initiation factor eIF-1A [Halorubrum sp. Ea1]
MSNGDGDGRNDLRMPDEDEVFAEVVEMLGANRVRVRCADGKERTARIPGRMQKRVWIREDDIVLVEPWDWQDEKGDIAWRYEKSEAEQLREEGHLQ